MVGLVKGSDDYERTIVFGEQAIGHIKSHRTSAYPRIYELWYTFSTGHNAPLNKAISTVLERNDGISEQEIEEIYDNYLSPLRFSDRVDQVGSRLMGEIDQVMAMVESAMGKTASYGKELRGAVDELRVSAETREQVKALVENVIGVVRD